MNKFLQVALLFLFCLSCQVFASQTAENENSDVEIGEASISCPVHGTVSVTFLQVPSSARNLPRPPSTSQDIFHPTAFNQARSVQSSRGVNVPRSHPLSEQHLVRMEVIPQGLRPHWIIIKAELEWFDSQEQKDTLIELFKCIVNDNPRKFKEFEPQFQKVFESDYKGFSMHGRSVFGWLITFGSLDILTSSSFTEYQINEAVLEQAYDYLVRTHPMEYISRLVALFPFVLKTRPPALKGLLHHVVQSSRLSPESTLAFLFAGLKEINLTHIAALIPLLGASHQVNHLIRLSSGIAFQFRHMQEFYASEEGRSRIVTRFKVALMNFFIFCLPDFNKLLLRDRFSIAHLFIEFDNVEALKKLLTSPAHRGMISRYANGKRLIQVCIEKSAFKCAKFIMALDPTIVTSPSLDGNQAPIVQSIITLSFGLFEACLENLTSNKPIEILGISTKFTPIGLAILFGQDTFLDQILKHFERIKVSYDIRFEFDKIYSHLDAVYLSSNGQNIRNSAFIHHSTWLYLLKNTQISVDIIRNYSLLDYAVLDRNFEAVKFIVNERGFDVNTIVATGNIRGNCLRFVRNSIPVFKTLLEIGINVNIPVTVINSPNLSNGIYSEQMPMLAYLMSFSDPAFQQFLSQVQFSLEAVQAAEDYARSKQFYGTITVARLIMQKYIDGTYN